MDDLKILFVDDEREILSIVKEYLSLRGYDVMVADNGNEALEAIKEKGFDIVFTDLNMPGCSGMELLAATKEHLPETEVVIVTGHGTIESAIEALRLGSYDYLQKPIKLERLKILIDRISEKNSLKRENILIKRRLKERYQFDELVGVSPKMQEIYEIIDRISINTPTVLIQGESGTGKEVVAKVIHQNSGRKGMPFIPVNCGAMVEGLLESELFGHVKGSFTGAIKDKIGLFKAAEGGTIFLDEIAELTPNLQVKLLRVLQEKKIRAVGDTSEYNVEARVIAATNRNLEEAIKSGALRRDLFYRLNVVSVRMPPLRERKEDVPLFINYFLNKFNVLTKRKVSSISQEAMNALLNYNWPGNVRQLENAIERAFVLGVGESIELTDLPSEVREFAEAPRRMGATLNLKENEIILIKESLDKTGGNKAKAADLLGINLTTLYRKIKKYGMLPICD
ncbi:Acetoacetate metabolism regulatory protein AtoC [uncultured Desulfobacterium sp.]|uniref:Acetoacetate metabolism regulatory protein AtoC n=1 Tax=uncultured Desulfobacterium sp. TaxID=201089 RepID=A0A445MUL8_9BACT|nr:Acetoacetate metabolism regulatory protein AtoC [uncultured Desulfobacterium sp.]